MILILSTDNPDANPFTSSLGKGKALVFDREKKITFKQIDQLLPSAVNNFKEKGISHLVRHKGLGPQRSFKGSLKNQEHHI